MVLLDSGHDLTDHLIGHPEVFANGSKLLTIHEHSVDYPHPVEQL